MADSSALSALRVPGKVTFGGEDLGLVAQVQLRRTGEQTPIMPEEFGKEVTDSVYVGATYRLGLALRGWDPTAIRCLFVNTVAGAKVIYPGPNLAGYFRRADARRLRFVPTDEDAHPGIEFPLAIPEVLEELEVDLAQRTEHLILCSFLAIRDGTTPTTAGQGVTWGL